MNGRTQLFRVDIGSNWNFEDHRGQAISTGIVLAGLRIQLNGLPLRRIAPDQAVAAFKACQKPYRNDQVVMGRANQYKSSSVQRNGWPEIAV